MDVTVEVVGEGSTDVDADEDATYADLVRAVGYNTHEVTVLVDGRPVPEDERVAADSVRVLRLVKGGSRMRVRAADTEDYRTLMRVVEGALLDVDPETVRSALHDDGGGDGAFLAADDGRTVGALVCDGPRVVAVAVVPGRRGEGIGRALVERADAATTEPLVATFDGRVRPFYESLGFEIEASDGRYRGVRR